MSGNKFSGIKIKRVEISHDGKLARAAQLQIFALDRIARLTGGQGLVFHGGTSVAMMHGSPRWSEDLDFMASTETIARVMAACDALQRDITMDCSTGMPGSQLTLQTKGPEHGEIGSVSKINLRWEHPMLFGVIRIKLEFYGCTQDALDLYKSTPRLARLEGHKARFAIPSADLESIWGDKVLAMAQRPVLKHRDQHDLGFISPLLPSEDRLSAALEASRNIYGLPHREVTDGLCRSVVLNHVDDRAAFDQDMMRWFGREDFDIKCKNGYLDSIFSGFQGEFSRARLLAEDCLTDYEANEYRMP